MKPITIPLFHITFHINPVAFSLFGVPIYWYAILIVASIILALFLMKRRSKPLEKKAVPTCGSTPSCQTIEQEKGSATSKKERKHVWHLL